MSRYRSRPPSLVPIAILAIVIIVGGSLVRAGGDEPKPNPSSTKTAEFPWIESPRVGDESKAADPVAMLLRRVEALESRVATLERERPSSIAPSSIGQPATSENWRSFEFNGQMIYFEPTASSLDNVELNAASIIEDLTPTRIDHYDTTLLKYEPLPPSRK
jgi:hypothetical protein